MRGVGIAMSRAGRRAGAAPTSGRGFDVVRVALAAILLTAAGLKAHQLATEPVAGTDIFSYRGSLMAQVEFEIVLGVWLLSGLRKRLAWAAALACFVFFCGVTLYKALSGAASCGCFGRVQVSPWYTLVLDVWAVFALLVFPPKAAPAAPRKSHRRRLLVTALATLLVGVPTGLAMGTYQRDDGDAQMNDAGPPHSPAVSEECSALAKDGNQIRHGDCSNGPVQMELSTQEMQGSGNYLRQTPPYALPDMTQSSKGGMTMITH